MSNGFLRELLLTAAALAAVLALAWVLLRALRGRLRASAGPGTAADEPPRFVRAVPVGPRERVVVMDYRGERFLLGVTAGGIQVLDRHAAIGSTPSSESPQLPGPPPASQTAGQIAHE